MEFSALKYEIIILVVNLFNETNVEFKFIVFAWYTHLQYIHCDHTHPYSVHWSLSLNFILLLCIFFFLFLLLSASCLSISSWRTLYRDTFNGKCTHWCQRFILSDTGDVHSLLVFFFINYLRFSLSICLHYCLLLFYVRHLSNFTKNSSKFRFG